MNNEVCKAICILICWTHTNVCRVVRSTAQDRWVGKDYAEIIDESTSDDFDHRNTREVKYVYIVGNRDESILYSVET